MKKLRRVVQSQKVLYQQGMVRKLHEYVHTVQGHEHINFPQITCHQRLSNILRFTSSSNLTVCFIFGCERPIKRMHLLGKMQRRAMPR